MKRELSEDIGRSGDEGELQGMRAIVTDLQVRVAVLEAKEPVSKHEFDPIRRIVWGAVLTILSAVLIALLSFVVIKSGSLPTKP